MKFKNWQNVYSIEEIEAQVEASFPYEHFFKGQKQAIVQVVDAFLNGGKNHVILEAPTGSGKTMIAFTAHKVLDKLIGRERLKTTVTTTTKGLQQQYVKDTGTFNLMGKTNYPCPMGHEHYSTIGCKHLVSQKGCKPNKECPYVKTRITFTEVSSWRSTNTAMFLEMCPILCMMPDNKADMVVFDECHKLAESMCEHTILDFRPKDLEPLKILFGNTNLICAAASVVYKFLKSSFNKSQVGERILLPRSNRVMISAAQDGFEFFSDFIDYHGLSVNPNELFVHYPLESVFDYLYEKIEGGLKKIDSILKENETLDDSIKDVCERIILTLQHWSDVCEIVNSCPVEDFILQKFEDDSIEFKPLLASQVSHYSAFRKADYFLHMSATICGINAYAKELGLDESGYLGISMEHPVDVDRRRVKFIPEINMGGGYNQSKAVKMADAITQIYREFHQNENGLIHTASYKLAEEIKNNLPADVKRAAFIGRNREETMTALKMNRGLICLSPSMEEGYDLKHDLARWQVIAKVPFGFLGDPTIKYKSEKVEGSYSRTAVLRIVQACGRVVRGADDRGETYILDSGFDRLLNQGWDYFPKWFIEALESY